MDESPHLISNVQVSQLANSGEFRRPCDERDLRRAAEIVRRTSMPGVVEKYDESLAVAEYFLQPAFPELSLEYIPRNVNCSNISGATATEDTLPEMWGKRLYDELLRMNRLDLDLLQIGIEEVGRRSLIAPRFDARLENFKSRCLRLRAESARAMAVAG